MYTNDIIETDLKKNSQQLIDYLEGIDEADFIKKLNATEWSIMECMEHILIIENAVSVLFKGNKETASRDPYKKIALIKDRFYDFTSKYPAPEMIAPKGAYPTKSAIIEAFSQGRTSILQNGLASDWKELCMNFKHFGFGYLTQIEWIYFCIFHATRHLNQMSNMHQRIISLR